MSGGTINALIRLNGRVTYWIAVIAAAFLVIVATVTFCDVIARYFLLKPFTFTVEVTELGMALIVFLAVGLVTHDDSHINVDVVILRLSTAVRPVLLLITYVLALAYLVTMIWRLWLQAFHLLDKGDVTPIWAVPYWPVAITMAVGSLFLLTGTIIHIIGYVRRIRGADVSHLPTTVKPLTD
ncbi:MAG TPA: TRAP transporter small permease [Xanthobacteraceae bacterium]